MSLLQDKSTLVTGATRGIGREIALEFARQGAKVAFTFRSSVEKAESLAAEIEGMGGKALPFQADAADFEATQNVINSMAKEFGSIDVIVNNAGITKDNLLLRMSEEQFDQVIKTNLYSVYSVSYTHLTLPTIYSV